MYKMIIALVAISYTFSCSRVQQESKSVAETDILNGAFMDMISTTPYQYRNLRPAPGDSIHPLAEKFYVGITPYLTGIRKWDGEIRAVSKDADPSDRERIIALLEKSATDSLWLPLALHRFKNTGRYTLFGCSPGTLSMDTLSAIGHIQFTRTHSDGEYAITVAVIRDQIKNGIVKLFLLKRSGALWRKKQEFVLEIW